MHSGAVPGQFRVLRHPSRGAIGASVWYLQQVLSMLWQLIRPCALTLVVLHIAFGFLLAHDAFDADSVAFIVLKSLWYGSPVQAPGISLFDATMYAWAGYRATRHSLLLRSGILAGAATSLIGFATLFTTFAIMAPRLLLAPLAQPFVVVILSTLLSVAVGYGILFGILGGTIGRSWQLSSPLEGQSLNDRPDGADVTHALVVSQQ
jgi:hypothetical protein